MKLDHRGGALRLEPLESRRLLSAVELVLDINPSTGVLPWQSQTDVGSVLYFRANDGVNGYELWRSDGTTAGTFLVEDIHPGPSPSYPRYLTNVGGVLYFSASDNTTGFELWRSDGTTSGTFLVENIRPGSYSSYPRYLTNVGGVLYFQANDGVTGKELWRSDGTTSGTFLVKDIYPGDDRSVPSNLTNVGGVLYFRANNGVNNYELWRSDGTTFGTFLVKDIYPGSNTSYPQFLTNVGGVLHFNANDGVTGRELWRSDGTTSGTFVVEDIRPGPSSSDPRYLTNVGGVLYFSASDNTTGFELWRSDGTTSKTFVVENIRPGFYGSYPQRLTNVGGVLYFSANDGVTRRELWRSDGTTSGTFVVEDISPGFYGSYPRSLTNVGGVLYFRAFDNATGFELWRSDGTTSGTFLVEDIRPGSLGSTTSAYFLTDSLTNVGGVLYFSANDGAHGYELWRTTTDSAPPKLGAGNFLLNSTAGVHPPYAIPVGSGEQLRTAPVGRVDRITITFPEAVVVAIDDLSLSGANPYGIAGFTYDPQTFVAVWTLTAPIMADELTLTLADSVADLAGNPLDGEWDNPLDLADAMSSTISGDGIPGGDFIFRFTVLPGDGNRDNQVTGADYTTWADHFDNGQGAADAVFAEGDFNGDGHVTGADYTLWADNFGLDFRAAPGSGRTSLAFGSLGIAAKPLLDSSTGSPELGADPNEPVVPAWGRALDRVYSDFPATNPGRACPWSDPEGHPRHAVRSRAFLGDAWAAELATWRLNVSSMTKLVPSYRAPWLTGLPELARARTKRPSA